MTRTIDSSVAYFLKLQSSLLSLPIREFKKLRLLLQQKLHFQIKLCFRLTVLLLFLFYHVVQNRRGALSLAWHEWFPRKSKEWKIYCCGLALSPEPQIGSLRSTTRRQRQRHKFCIFSQQKPAKHHFTAREDMNSTNWPGSQCVASHLSWPHRYRGGHGFESR